MASIVCAVLTLGLSGMVAQIMLLRELLVVFSGNELFMGLFIGLWVAGEAIGALWSERVNRSVKDGKVLFVVATAGFILLLLSSLLLARVWKPLCGIPLEVSSGLWPLVIVSTSVLLPVAIIHGFLFISACVIVKVDRQDAENSVGLAYSWETLGSIVGGMLVSWVLVTRLSSFDIALLLALLNSCACFVLLSNGKSGGFQLRALFAFIAIIAGLSLIAGFGQLLHETSISWQWRGADLLSYRNSHYQNIVVTENSGQYTIFTNGLPQLTLPSPDIEHVEELAHIPLLMHPGPRHLLVIGGGAGGLISELLKHPSVRSIDYLEPDSLLLASIQELPPGITGGELSDARVNLVTEDAAVFIGKGEKRYDVVVMNLPLPETLQANRFFTRRFFDSVRRTLNDGGILAVPSTGSDSYYSSELRLLNASLSATLGKVFTGVTLIAGYTNIFIAAKTPLPPPDASVMSKRQRERGIETRLVTPEHLSYRLAKERGEWVASELARVHPTVNEDYLPSLMYWNIAYRSRVHTPTFSVILQKANRAGTLLVAILVPVVLFAAIFIRRAQRTTLSLAVAATGMASMLGELLLMTVFQVFYGSLFHLVGMLFALFMAGIAGGAYLATLKWVRSYSGSRVIIWLETAMVALFALQALVLWAIDRGSFESMRLALLLSGVFVTGVLTGMTYPVASRLYREIEGADGGGVEASHIRGAGFIYAADLFGGFAGGTIGAILLLPAFGVTGSFLFLVLLKGFTALLFVRAWGAGRSRQGLEY